MIASASWNYGCGAATWGNGATGITGPVTASNSLVGMAGDAVSASGVVALSNGNYVVLSVYWRNGDASSAGAATWGNGSTGTTGVVSINNSLVGTSLIDQVGIHATALTNGNYVVGSPAWAGRHGAATWGNGSSGIGGIKGEVSASNSLVGSSDTDFVGGQITALTNGNYVVESSSWNGSVPYSSVGAVTWGNGGVGVKGVVSASNSLVGTTYGDHVGMQGVIALSNGNYVVASGFWSNIGAPNTEDIGAATWGNGSIGITGPLSASNSLLAVRFRYDRGVHALSNGNYVVASPDWNNSPDGNLVGAATWGNGFTGTKGSVMASNSLIGTHPGDRVGNDGLYGRNSVVAFSDGNFVVVSVYYNGRGAVTLANGATLKGTVEPSNSVLGTTLGGGTRMVHAYDAVRHSLVVGRPADNIVTLITEHMFSDGFEP